MRVPGYQLDVSDFGHFYDAHAGVRLSVDVRPTHLISCHGSNFGLRCSEYVKFNSSGRRHTAWMVELYGSARRWADTFRGELIPTDPQLLDFLLYEGMQHYRFFVLLRDEDPQIQRFLAAALAWFESNELVIDSEGNDNVDWNALILVVLNLVHAHGLINWDGFIDWNALIPDDVWINLGLPRQGLGDSFPEQEVAPPGQEDFYEEEKEEEIAEEETADARALSGGDDTDFLRRRRQEQTDFLLAATLAEEIRREEENESEGSTEVATEEKEAAFEVAADARARARLDDTLAHLREALAEADARAKAAEAELATERARSVSERLEALRVGADNDRELGDLREALKRASEKVTAELARRKERHDECTVCMDAPRAVVFLPCKHRAVCAACSPNCDVCPLCRAPIENKIVPIG